MKAHAAWDAATSLVQLAEVGAGFAAHSAEHLAHQLFKYLTARPSEASGGESSRLAPAPNNSGRVWRPLEPGTRNIRLLRLEPESIFSSAFSSSSVTCSLVEVPLDDAPPFHALSYCWGQEAASCLISCDGCPVLVRPNLFAALRELQSRREYGLVWADALCIDQLNVEEKGQQVALMGDIYQAAQKTVVWLGTCDDGREGRAAVQTLRKLADARRRHPDALDAAAAGMDSFFTLHGDGLRALGLPGWRELHEPALAPLHRLFTRPWFSRAWIIQEVVLARDVVCFYGPSSFAFDDLLASEAALMYVSGWHHYSNGLHRRRGRQLGDTRAEVRSSGLQVLKVLNDHRAAESSDPRDKIYSMLGIFRMVEQKMAQSDEEKEEEEEEGEEEEERRPLLTTAPDYAADMSEVSLRFAIDLLRVTERLDALCFLRASDVPPDLSMPFWVRDWSTTQQEPRIYYESVRQQWCAAGQSARDYSVAGRSLRLRCQVLDEIVAVSHFIPSLAQSGIDPDDYLEERPVAAMDIAMVLKSRCETCSRIGDYAPLPDISAQRAFWHTLYMRADYDALIRHCCEYNTTTMAEHAILRAVGDSAPELKLIGEALQQQARPPTPPTPPPPPPHHPHPNDNPAAAGRHPKEKKEEKQRLGWVVQERVLASSACMARTRRGYYCHVPFLADVGDVVVLAAGGRTPFVCSPLGEPDAPDAETRGGPGAPGEEPRGGQRYALLGGCYVHGVMFGEAWRPELAGDMWFE